MLLAASWAIAYALSPWLTTQQIRVTYRHSSTRRVIKDINYVAMYLKDANKLTHSNLVNSPELANTWSQVDSWGRPIQYVMDESGNLIMDDWTLLAYSLGEDGKSESNGNDADDINTWDEHHIDYYWTPIRNQHMRKLLWRAVWATPLIFGLLLLGDLAARKALARNANDVCRGPVNVAVITLRNEAG